MSQRAAQDEDRARQREELFEKLKVGDVITGKVSGVHLATARSSNLGGADGLIHISELSWDRDQQRQRRAHVGDELIGQGHQARPRAVAHQPLAAPDVSRIPGTRIEHQFPPGKAVAGIVTKTKKYGAFLQIADGVEGLLHISELSWDHVERTEDVLKVGEEVEVMVLSADKVRRRISLSLRQLHGGGPTGEGGEFIAPSYDYPEDDDDDSGPVVSGAVAPVAAPAEDVIDVDAEEITRKGVEEDVAAGRATAEEIVTENALADDAAAFDEAGDDDAVSELEAEVQEAADSDRRGGDASPRRQNRRRRILDPIGGWDARRPRVTRNT